MNPRTPPGSVLLSVPFLERQEHREKGTSLACVLGAPCRSKVSDLFSPRNLPQMPEQIPGRVGNTRAVVLRLVQDMEQGQV